MTQFPMEQSGKRLILGSGSAVRSRLLRDAGLTIEVIPADVDEAAIRQALDLSDADMEPGDVAEILARTKAETVSAAHPEALVIGADQILCFEDRIFEKSPDFETARETLLTLRGGTHRLISAVCLAENGDTVWHFVDQAELTVRPMSEAFIGRYLAAAGEQVLSSVGVYQLEGLGSHFFESIRGDYFTVLGLPLLPLLETLRERKVLQS